MPARHAAATVALWDHALAALGPTADQTEIARWLRDQTHDQATNIPSDSKEAS